MALYSSGTSAVTGGKLTTAAGVVSGHVLQVKSTVVTALNSTNTQDASGIGGDVGLNLVITPVSSSSYFLIMCMVGIATCEGNSWAAILSRDGSKVGNGTDTGVHRGAWFRGVDHTGNSGSDTNHGVGGAGLYMDTTSGTAGVSRTYRCGFVSETGTFFLNRVESDYSGGTNAAPATYTTTTFTVMEIQS